VKELDYAMNHAVRLSRSGPDPESRAEWLG
jgi:hypothetical protein